MSLIIKDRGSGDLRLSNYKVPDTSLDLWILHGTRPSFQVTSPIDKSVPEVLEIFRYIAGKEPPEDENPLEVRLYANDADPPYTLDVDPSLMEPALEKNAGYVKLHLPQKYFTVEGSGEDRSLGVTSFEEKFPSYIQDVLQKFGAILPPGLDADLRQFEQELGFFRYLAGANSPTI